MATLVVGIDGSAGARAAVSFAVEEARLRNASLRLVCAWQVPYAAYGGGMAPPPFPELAEDLERQAHAVLDEAVQGIDREGVQIETVVREGAPARVLIEESDSADMLIVGSRGLGGFTGLLLGSVSTHCAHHANCPVVIVRGDSAAHG